MQGWWERRPERIAERWGGRRARGKKADRQPERDEESGPGRTLEQRARGVNVAEYTRTIRAQAPRNRRAMSDYEDEQDEEFPAGDGTVETGATVLCPYCGEINEISLDPGSGRHQEYVEDCQVCCRPWRVVVTYLPDGTADVSVEAESLD